MARSPSRWLLLLVLLLLISAAVVWWTRRPPVVDIVEIHAQPLVRSLRFAARVVPQSRVDVGSTLTGRVVKVLVDEGAQVTQGAVLVELETRELRAALAQAEASRQQARARLTGLGDTGRAAAQAQVAQAQAGVDASQAEFARVQQLVAQGFVSASRLDDARRARDVAQAQRAGAQAQLQAVSDAGTELAQARAQLELANANVGAGQARLAQATLRAPADALVLLRLVEPGQIVQPGRPLLTLALAGATELSAQVDERFLDQLQPGQQAQVVADAYPGRRFPARVTSIAPSVDAQRGSIEVKFALDGQAPAFLRQDMTLSVEVETGRRDRALVVPVTVLSQGADPSRASLRLVQDGVVEERGVVLGLRTLGAVEVVQGLADGDEVVLDRSVEVGRRVHTRVVEAQLDSGPGGAGGAASGAAQLTNMMGR